MLMGLVGRKCGMTRIFTPEGASVPVTVVEVAPNKVCQIKTEKLDGYNALQITMGTKRPSRVSKPAKGHFAKASVEAGEGLWEFPVPANVCESATLGQEFKVDIFTVGQWVDVKGTSKGKGFAGVIKRHNFSSLDATHGNSLSHRAPGSIGQRQSPGRVFKKKKMAGHLGNAACTVQNQQIVQIDSEKNLLLIRGAIPGAPGNKVIILPAIKMINKGRGDK